MSEAEIKGQEVPVLNEEQGHEVPTKRTVFTRNDVIRNIEVKVALPALYPDFDPWVFRLRLKMTSDAEERRQEYLALSPTEQTIKEADQNLDELCDLIVVTPKGFGDLQDNGQGPGSSFKDYVQTATAEQRPILDSIVRGAMTLYWRKTSPQEFRS